MVLDKYELDAEAPVLVIGAANIDVVGRLEAGLEAGTSNPARIRSSFGGTARNVAENLARLGQPVTLISMVGGDQVGDQLLQHTEQAGVDIKAVQVSPPLPTGSYVAVVDAQGELALGLDDMRAMQMLSAAYLRDQASLFGKASMLFLDANLQADALEAALDLAAAAKLPVCADPTSTGLAARLQAHLHKLFLLVPNAREAAVYLGRELDPRDSQAGVLAAKELVARGVEFAIITLAEFGLAYANAEGSGHIPAIRTEIVDPTGGGDALSAAVIFALLNGVPADEAVRLGISAASLTLRRRGSVREDLSLELLYDQLVI